MTHLTLVRHGTTEWLEQGRLHGIMDSPLSAKGKQEAELAAQALAGQHFDALYVSPLGRARQTADIIGQAVGLKAEPLDDLREMNFGWMEGGRNFNLMQDPPVKRALRAAWIGLIVQLSGEPRPKFGRRVAAAALDIARRHPDGRVLAVVHMGVRNQIVAHLVDGNPAAFARYDGWPTGAFTEIEIPPEGKARLIRLNVNDHLNTLRSSP
jgi:broad specificity phosphatase PhoE